MIFVLNVRLLDSLSYSGYIKDLQNIRLGGCHTNKKKVTFVTLSVIVSAWFSVVQE